jgi:quercetin dioxygenase-like cupin family protein
MELVDFSPARAIPITGYASRGASLVPLGHGSGTGHVYGIHMEPGGEIAPHEAGFGQLFLVVAGAGWVSGADGVRVPVATGTGAYIPRGEVHAKGTASGMTAIMVQLSELHAATPV